MEGRSGSRIYLVAAMLTRIAAALLNAVELRILAALLALVTLAKAGQLEMFETAFLGREAILKFAEGESVLGHAIM